MIGGAFRRAAFYEAARFAGRGEADRFFPKDSSRVASRQIQGDRPRTEPIPVLTPSSSHDQSPMLARTHILIGALLLAASAALPAGAETVMQVDLRAEHRPEPIQRYVVLCARKSESWGTGHSFVVWVTHDWQTNTTESKGYGFYPGAQRVLIKLAGGKGQLVDESSSLASVNSGLLTHRLIFLVDKERFESSWSAKEQWEEAQPNYNLFARNCTHFAHRVGVSLGLDPPKPITGERPPLYFDRLTQFCSELSPPR